MCFFSHLDCCCTCQSDDDDKDDDDDDDDDARIVTMYVRPAGRLGEDRRSIAAS